MGLPVRKTEKHFSYADYKGWPDDERWELIDGVAYCMSPAPTSAHQALAGEFYWRIAAFLHGKSCRAFMAPFDVRLAEADATDDQVINVVQPDIVVYCDTSKIDQRGGKGAPEWIIEVLSPSTAARDQREKLALYERFGVEEYWLVHPGDRLLTIYRRNESGLYGRAQLFDEEATVTAPNFPELNFSLMEIFSVLPESL